MIDHQRNIMTCSNIKENSNIKVDKVSNVTLSKATQDPLDAKGTTGYTRHLA